MTQYVIKNDNFINILNGSTLPAKSLNPELVSSISIFKNNTSIVNFRNENKDPKPHKRLYLIWTRLIVLPVVDFYPETVIKMASTLQ